MASKAFSSSRWNLGNRLRSLDSFGAPIPSFNVKGKSHATTRIGGFLTVFIFTLTLAFGV